MDFLKRCNREAFPQEQPRYDAVLEHGLPIEMTPKLHASPRVLFLGPESAARDKFSHILNRSGLTIETVHPRHAELRISSGAPYALILLDTALLSDALPTVCSMQRMTRTPLLVLTERSHVPDCLASQGLCTTETLFKPCAPGDLLTRVWALIFNPKAPDVTWPRLADLAIDRKRGKAFRRGIDLRLTATQFDLLDVLMAHPGRVMSRERLMAAVWGPRVDPQCSIVRVAMLRLRQRLDAPFDLKLIHTVHYEGYVVELRL
ncbi:response regulator transcription factor [Variovorax gossypii]|uniref:Response regulator transcription factor n=1 Tax=Variovorax gossypii TaxID=1679495 RepID=A0A3S0IFQ9_9BURK|nr:response regulator transcription factor [Variovorax paradoxus]MDR6522089.1 two-component system copper resistance phosphate regulon response regulator CusR [Variovorax paradoxus]RTQ35603.1 response regulator transcription factor [Variovorax gossypii]